MSSPPSNEAEPARRGLSRRKLFGTAGVTALFQRSVFLRMAEYPWLANVGDSSPSGGFNSLRRELSQHRQADAAAANAALLQSLAQVLGNLIGASLTTRLLQSVFEKRGRTTQDKSAQ